MPLHRVEDVTDSVREDLGRPSSCGGSEGDEDGLLIRHRVVHRSGIEDVSSYYANGFAGSAQASGVAGEDGDRMTVGDRALGQQAARLAGGPKDDDLQDSAH